MLMLPDFRVRQRDFLLQISRAITAQLDLNEVLRRVLHASVAMMAGQVGLVALRAQDADFYVRAVRGVDPDRIPALDAQLKALIRSLESDRSGQPDLLNEKLREMAAFIDPSLAQSIALPLSFAQQPLGLLIVFRSYRSAVTSNDLQVLQSFADQAAIAVHNAQLYEAINQERMRLEAILDHSADGVMILDHNLTILHFNESLARLSGWPSEQAVGSHYEAVIQWERLDSIDLKDALASGWPFNSETQDAARNTLYVEGDLLSRGGLPISVGITYAPMLTEDGRLATVIANVRDITNFRREQEMQNVFISGVSHELKTPVAIIKGYAATLRRDDADWDADVIKSTLGVIEEEADRLTDLIQDLLTASRLQAQRQIRLDLGEVFLDELSAQVVERFQTQTQRHILTLAFPPDFPPVQADEVRLRQVLDNLVGNAIKYSPQGGTIEVGGNADRRTVTLYVRDEGVGLSGHDRQRVFDRFYRVDSSLSRRTQGTGLGLYLARAIISAHKGVIDLDSTPGVGSTFFFTLPREQALRSADIDDSDD